MARQPGLDLPGIAQHVVQRGNDRQPCFFSPIDYQRYRHDLREIAMAEDCAVHAYVLMTNHVHMLLTPCEPGSVARLMQSLGRRYVNDRYHRTGTLWEGRYKACPVDGKVYLLRCHRYIELNPVRAAMVADPAGYPWSRRAAAAQRRGLRHHLRQRLGAGASGHGIQGHSLTLFPGARFLLRAHGNVPTAAGTFPTANLTAPGLG